MLKMNDHMRNGIVYIKRDDGCVYGYPFSTFEELQLNYLNSKRLVRLEIINLYVGRIDLPKNNQQSR
jgi:hypothetical protein